MLFVTQGILFLPSLLSEFFYSWKHCTSLSIILLFLFLTNFWNFFSLRTFSSFLVCAYTLLFFLFFLCLLMMQFISLHESVVWLQFPCKIKFLQLLACNLQRSPHSTVKGIWIRYILLPLLVGSFLLALSWKSKQRFFSVRISSWHLFDWPT